MLQLTAIACLALALDYDLFLLCRIRWHRFHGKTHRESIVQALDETGSTINWAGVIMSIALGGNILGDVTMMNQAAFIMATSVLLDSFAR